MLASLMSANGLDTVFLVGHEKCAVLAENSAPTLVIGKSSDQVYGGTRLLMYKFENLFFSRGEERMCSMC